MGKLILILVVAFVVVVALIYLSGKSRKGAAKGQTVYSYFRKDYFMSQPEHNFFDILVEIVGSNYYVFPQVHLSTILSEKVKGQNWKAALRHINQKSVDFVICDKANLKPLLAIELDDSSHNLEERRFRDIEVERIFEEAKLPLVRFENRESHNKEIIKQRISELLPGMSI